MNLAGHTGVAERGREARAKGVNIFRIDKRILADLADRPIRVDTGLQVNLRQLVVKTHVIQTEVSVDRFGAIAQGKTPLTLVRGLLVVTAEKRRVRRRRADQQAFAADIEKISATEITAGSR